MANSNGNRRRGHDTALFVLGVVIIGGTWVVTELLDKPFHVEYLFLGAALCGIGATQWRDKQ